MVFILKVPSRESPVYPIGFYLVDKLSQSGFIVIANKAIGKTVFPVPYAAVLGLVRRLGHEGICSAP